MLAPKRYFLDNLKVCYGDTERWLLAWNKNKYIIY